MPNNQNHKICTVLIERRENTMLELLKDLWGFLRERKKFWLAPIILVIVMLGALIVLSEGSAIAPFIYTLF
jgi:hypothetical protein